VHQVAIAGAGIVGLATAYALVRDHPGLDVVLLEKEDAVARHQTGHNSGVIHSGAYYRPGSKKAEMCLRGRKLLMEFCDSHSIPYRICGKLIVATAPSELGALAKILERARANSVAGIQELTGAEIHRLEPLVNGIAGLEVPTAGIVDYKEVCRVLAEEIERRGGRILTKTRLDGIAGTGHELVLRSGGQDIPTRFLVNCAGLQSDRVALMAGVSPATRIIPFRGEYFWLRPGACSGLGRLIYPVPDPNLPFLGVHLTLTLHGRVEAGPNAVFAFAREAYARSQFELGDVWDALAFRGFWSMARQHWKTGLFENYRSLDRERFAADVARLVPSISARELAEPGAGVRAQAVGPDGRLIDDFVIQPGPNSIHVLNAPSPAATSSLAIGETIAAMVPGVS